MGPTRAIPGYLEPTDLVVGAAVGVDQGRDSVLIKNIEAAVGVSYRSRAATVRTFVFPPHDLTGLDVSAVGPAAVVGVAKDMIADQNDTAMLVFQLALVVFFLDP